MMRIFNLRIAQKLGLVAAIAAVGMAATAGIAFYTTDAINASVAKERNATEVVHLADAIQIDMLQERRNEKDFLLRKEDKYVTNHSASAAHLDKLLGDLSDRAGRSGLGEVVGDTEQLPALHKQYVAKFQELVSQNRALGLTHEEGLQGKLRKAVHDLEEMFSSVSNDTLQVSLLSMRRSEKDFIMRLDEKYVSKLAAQKESLAADPAFRRVDLEMRGRPSGALDLYHATFAEFAAASMEEASIRKEVSSAYSAIEPVFAKIRTAVDEAKEAMATERSQTESALAVLNISVTIALVLITTGCLFLLARSISRPTVALGQSMRSLAEGSLEVEVPATDRTDEIGTMARAVQVFKEQALAKIRLEREADEQSSLTETERRKNEEARAKSAAEQTFVVSQLASGLGRLSQGDLLFRLEESFPSEYERLRHDFNSAIEKLAQAMSEVLSATNSINGGSSEMFRATDDLSRRTEQQAASLEETAAAIEQLTATVKRSAEVASHADGLVQGAKRNAEKSGAVVERAVSAMGTIESSATQIGQIISVIDEIAFQTNLLALNAGVEAARAGEAGRGFAVVAQEVRALAQRAAEAAKEIKELINSSTIQVAEGVELVGETGKVLTEIIGQVAEVSGIIADLAVAAQEQSTGLGQINVAVSQMDGVTQQNAAMVEESAAACSALLEESENLKRLMNQFRTELPVAAQLPQPPRRSVVANIVSGVASAAQRLPKMLKKNGPISAGAGFATAGNAALNMPVDPGAVEWEEF